MAPQDTDTALPEFLKGAGLPLKYVLMGRTAMFYPTPTSAYCTLSSGAAFYVDRDVTEFATSATTSTPGFATPFHKILSYSGALEFVQDAATRQHLAIQKDKLEKGLVRFYGNRMVERPTIIKPHSRKAWRQYI